MFEDIKSNILDHLDLSEVPE